MQNKKMRWATSRFQQSQLMTPMSQMRTRHEQLTLPDKVFRWYPSAIDLISFGKSDQNIEAMCEHTFAKPK